MKKQFFLLPFLWFNLHLHAQGLFRPTRLTATPTAHKTFMAAREEEVNRKATLWNVPTLAIQVIASVQSGAGSQPGFNYGAVLPHPGITKYAKFSTVNSDGLINCTKAARGIEVIAMALDILNSNNKNTLTTDQQFLQKIFGSGGDLESMALEAEQAYQAYTNKSITLFTLEQTSPDNISGAEEITIEIQETEVTTIDNHPTTTMTREEQRIALEAAQLKASQAAEREVQKKQKEVIRAENDFGKSSIDDSGKHKKVNAIHKKTKKVTFGIKAGVNAARILVKDNDDEGSKDDVNKIGGLGGLVVGIPLSSNSSLETGASFSMKGSKLEDNNSSGGGSKLERTLNYIQIPLHFKTLFGNRKNRFFIQAGPYLGMAIYGKETTSTDMTDITFGNDDDDIKPFDYGAGAALGGQFGKVQIGVSYDWGLANLSNITTNGLKVQHRVAGMFLGYML